MNLASSHVSPLIHGPGFSIVGMPGRMASKKELQDTTTHLGIYNEQLLIDSEPETSARNVG